MKSLTRSLLSSAALLSLAACGGGGGGGFFVPTTAASTATAASSTPSTPLTTTTTAEAPATTTPDPVKAAPANTAPVAHAGTDQKVGSGTTVTLDGAGSTDADADPLSYSWTLGSKPAGSAATLSGEKTVTPTFVPDLPGVYVATLVANDGKSDSASASVTITVEAVVAFDSLTPLPPNMPSLGFQATSTASLGDRIELKAGAPRTLNSIAIAMSSWACQTGGVYSADCYSAPNATFSHPIKLKVFDSTGKLVVEQEQIFAIPYRPTVDIVDCPAGGWKASDGKCYNGFANQIVFDLASLKVTLPDDKLYYEISYNTNTWGSSPLGVSGPYDSLNVGLHAMSVSPTVGADQDPGIVQSNGADYNISYGIMAKVFTTAP